MCIYVATPCNIIGWLYLTARQLNHSECTFDRRISSASMYILPISRLALTKTRVNRRFSNTERLTRNKSPVTGLLTNVIL